MVAVAFFALAAAGRVDFAIVSESRSTGVSERKPVGTGVDKRVVDMVAFRKKWENSELEENERATLYLDAATSKSGTLFLPRYHR